MFRGIKLQLRPGTSEVRDVFDENGSSYLRVGSTIAFAPSDDPQVAVLIVCDEPMVSQMYGAYVAAPYVAAVMEEILPYIGVERNWTDEERVNMNTTIGNYVGYDIASATAGMKNLGIKYNIIGDGDIINYQAPRREAVLINQAEPLPFIPEMLFRINMLLCLICHK